MMEEEEETLFDQEGLLGSKEESTAERKEWKRKILKTAALSMAFFCMGICIAIPGSTIQDLGDHVNKSVAQVAFIFTARAFGYLVGSLVGGVLFDLFDQQVLLFYTLSAAAVATTVVPWCTALLILSLMIAVHGVAIGVLDSGGNVFCIKIWGKRSPSYMQILHFAFGLGAFLAPLLARPFLNDQLLTYPNDTLSDTHYPINTRLTSWGDQELGRELRDLHLFEDTNIHHLSRREAVESVVDLPDSVFLNSLMVNVEKRDADLINSSASGVPLNASDDRSSLNGTNILNTTLVPTTTTTTTPKPKKPDVISGEHLKVDSADGANNNPRLQKLKDNPITATPEKAPTTIMPIVSGESAGNLTSENTTLEEQGSQNVTVGEGGEGEFEGREVSKDRTGDPQEAGDILSSDKSPSPTTLPPTSPSPTTTTTTTTTISTTITTPTPSTTSTTTTTTTSTPLTSNAPGKASTSSETISTDDSASENKNHKPEETVDAGLNMTAGNDTSVNGKTDFTSDFLQTMLETVRNMSRIQFAYLIIGLLLLVNAGIFLVLYCKDRYNSTPLYSTSHEDLTRPRDPKCFVASILSLLFCFFFVYVGMEVTFGGLITKFAHTYPKAMWTKADAVMLDAMFWGSIAAGRGISIFLAYYFKPPCMMVANLTLTVLGSLILSFGIYATPVLLWVGTMVLGLGMSSIFPTIISWTNSYYPLTGKATAVFITGSAVGEMIVPWLTGVLDTINRMALMYMTLTLAVLLSFLYMALQVIACQKSRSNPRRSHSGFMRLENSEDMADALDMDLMEETPMSGLRRRQREDEDVGDNHAKQNGTAQEVTEFTKLVELSD